MRKDRGQSSIFMRFFIPALIALLPLLAIGGSSSPSAQASAPMPQKPSDTANLLVLHVFFKDIAQRDQLANQYDAAEVSTQAGYLTIWADRPTYNDLLAQGLRVEIDQNLTAQAQQPVQFGGNPTSRPTSPDTFYGGYRTVEENYAYMDQLVAAYPNLAEKVDIGDSWCKSHPGICTAPAPTWNGYDLFVLHITNRSIPGPKPVYWFETGIHSREIATTEVATRFMSQLLDNYNSDPDSHWLVDWHDIWIMPHVNPDGHHMVEATGGPYLQRKNGDRLNGCTTWPPGGGQLGTDLNRNFSFLWGCCGGSSGSACSETYRGPSAASDDETLAVENEIRSLIPDQRGPNNTDPAPITTTGVYQSMHSNASLDLYPWGWTGTASPNGPEMANIGAHLSALNASPSGNGYQSCQPPNCLYGVDGDSADWGYGELGIPSFTTEVAGSTFFPPYGCLDHPYNTAECPDGDSTILNGIWPSNKGALIYSAKIARTPYLTTRGPDTKNTVSVPITVTQGTQAVLTATMNYVWTGNAYTQNVAAAEYYIDTPPWAGGTGIPMTGNFTSPTVAVQATVDTSALSVGRHILLLRGRGINDYSGLHSWGPITGVFLDVQPGGGGTPTPTTPPANTPTNTPIPTNTSILPTATNTAPPTPTTGADTATPVETPSATPTACTLSFSDVPVGSTFYNNIRCLACLGIVGGYPDGTFRPNNNVTRGQLSKIVSNSAGFNDPQTTQMFQDVPPGSTFFDFIGRLASRGYIGGYVCGGPGEPCLPGSLPYFRPNNNATRGQISKIVSNAAGLNDPPGTQIFEDVAPGSTFYDYIQRLASRNIMSGYQCGGPGEPCGPGQLPYFRPNNNATRGQTSKIVSNTFFPDCNPPASYKH